MASFQVTTAQAEAIKLFCLSLIAELPQQRQGEKFNELNGLLGGIIPEYVGVVTPMQHGPELEPAPQAEIVQVQNAPANEPVAVVEEVLEVTEAELDEIERRLLHKELEKLEKWYEFRDSCRIEDRNAPVDIPQITNENFGFNEVRKMSKNNYSDDVFRYYYPLGKVLEQLSDLCGGRKELEQAAKRAKIPLSEGHIWFLVSFARICTKYPKCKYTKKKIRFIKEIFAIIKTQLSEIFSEPGPSAEKTFWMEG